MLLPACVCVQAAPSTPDAVPAKKTFYNVVYWEGADRTGAAKILAALDKVEKDWPGLVTSAVLEHVVFVGPTLKLDNARYCWTQGGSCSAAKTILIDVPFVLSLETAYPDYFRKGREFEAVLFHELIHGWAMLQPELFHDYNTRASDGRLTAFQREKHKVVGKIYGIERRLNHANWRLQMGDDTRDQWLARKPNDPKGQKSRWRKAHRMRHQTAVNIIEREKERYEKFIAKFTRKENTPRRADGETHALANDHEWFAFGGEIAFYAAEPGELLSADERAWWSAAESELKGGQRTAFVESAEDD